MLTSNDAPGQSCTVLPASSLEHASFSLSPAELKSRTRSLTAVLSTEACTT